MSDFVSQQGSGNYLYQQYGGGLGDFYANLYMFQDLHDLEQMNEGDKAYIVAFFHNPTTEEFFTLHKKASQIELLNFGYYASVADAMKSVKVYQETGKLRDTKEYQGNLADFAKRYSYNEIDAIVKRAFATQRRVRNKNVPIPIPTNYMRILEDERFSSPYVIVSGTAGEKSRDIPEEEELWIVNRLQQLGYRVVIVGRDYERFDKTFEREHSGDLVIDMRNKLNFWETIAVMRRAVGAVCSHSAISMLSWYERVPQLLLYGEDGLKNRFRPYQNGDFSVAFWCWGAYLPHNITIHQSEFRNNREAYLKKFISNTSKFLLNST